MAGGFTFAGKLETTSFPEIAGAVYRLGKSGELRVASAKRSRTIWFLDGNPVTVTSDDPRDHLARVLEESGKISAEDAARLEQIPEEKGLLQGIDFVPKEVLTWGLKSRFVQLCYDTFRWTDGEYRFQEGTPPKKLPLLKVPTPTMILKGVAYLPPGYLRRRIPGRGTIEAGAVSPDEATYLSADERSFLDICREGGEVGEVVAEGRDAEEARRQIFAFLALGLLSLRMPIHGVEAEEAVEPPEPRVMELTEEAIVPAPASAPAPPASPPIPPPLLPDEEEVFGGEPSHAPRQDEEGPRQEELPYRGTGVTIAPPKAKRRSIFLPLQKRGLWLVIAGFGVVVLVALWRVFSLITAPAPVPTPVIPLTRVFPTPRSTSVETAAVPEGSATQVAVAPPAAEPTKAAATPTPVPRATATAPPKPAPPAALPSPPPASSGTVVDRYREGLDVYRSGEMRRAAEVWAALLAGGKSGEFTIQIEIACSPDTVTKDFPALEPHGEPFILPYSYKGRPCYALCLGRFSSKAEADRVLQTLPSSYSEEGARVKPISSLIGQ